MRAERAPGGLALFADCLLAGLYTVLAAVPLVTAYPALVAGCAVLRARVRLDETVVPRRYWRAFRDVLRSGPAGLLVPPLVAAVLALDAVALATGAPGRGALAVPLAVAGCASAVLGLRTAGRWRAGARWPAVARAAVGDVTGDPGGTALLGLAAVAAGCVAVAVPVTVPLLGGPLALAVVAVDGRRAARGGVSDSG